MLNKEVCQKCYRYHERLWGDIEDEEWDIGRVMCPIDYFNRINYKGEVVDLDKPLRNLFSALYGWREHSMGIPDWCIFPGDHKETQQGEGV